MFVHGLNKIRHKEDENEEDRFRRVGVINGVTYFWKP
jgi:hypothetical protein